NRLFRNVGGGKFEDVSAGSGLDVEGHGMGVAVGDFDNDGRPDVYLSQYGGGRLFRNLGGVKFEDVTERAGVGQPRWGTSAAFFDGDGWPDVFVANDAHANRLWVNRRDGTFQDEAVPRGVAYNALGNAQANMGVALADVDGDGLVDLFVTHLTEETHALWRQG